MQLASVLGRSDCDHASPAVDGLPLVGVDSTTWFDLIVHGPITMVGYFTAGRSKGAQDARTSEPE
jgi:hypothetical protein